jgi:hypothetical protein
MAIINPAYSNQPRQQFKLGLRMSPTINGDKFPGPAVLLEVAPLQFRQQPAGRQSSRLTQEAPLSWEQDMVDPNIRERLAVFLPYLCHPHPYRSSGQRA